eukprot:PITA_21775
MWLVQHRKILTWDNIRKRGILGPSRCQLCEAQEETMEHLLNSYNEVLATNWALFPSFIVWNVWKERNNRISKDEKRTSHYIFELILKQLKETVSTIVRNLPKNPPSTTNLRILCELGLQGISPQGLDRNIISLRDANDFWHPPPKGYLKYNIDGASKGNSGTVGYGGVLRDENGSVLFIFHCHLGHATNKLEELMDMEQCLDFLSQENRQNVIVEVDSELIINSVKKISGGTKPEKVSKNWRLIQGF